MKIFKEASHSFIAFSFISIFSEMDLESQWELFMNEDFTEQELQSYDVQACDNTSGIDKEECTTLAPTSSPLKISTKTKIIYLNSTFDLNSLFWKLKTVNYDDEQEGIIKKQMKFNFTSPQEVVVFEENIKKEKSVTIKILNQINNPTGRVCFKDVRKVDIGLSKNDIINPKKKSKSAFYNCFVMIFRKRINGVFQEFHVKLFNSGKVEVPGIQSEHSLDIVSDCLVSYLQPYFKTKIFEHRHKRELILVNSNFNCNYYLNREKLVHILKHKYKIKCGMDSCSYPGIQCKYKLKNNGEMSFMIFRTGSVLIVGKCEDDELNNIYEFLTNMFKEEYHKIVESESFLEKEEKLNIKKKGKKKNKRSLSFYI